MKVRAAASVFRRRTAFGKQRNISEAFEKVRSDIEAVSGHDAVFQSHLEILEDPLLIEAIESAKYSGCTDREAVDEAQKSLLELFSSIDDEYLRARADDLKDVCGRLSRALDGKEQVSVELPAGCILVAEELLPSDMVSIDLAKVRGILCHKGSSTSHVCILARSCGVPVQVGVDVSRISDGQIVEVDDPLAGGNVVEIIRQASRKVLANAGNVQQVRDAIASGADGIGLFRTEFLFLGTSEMPSLEWQKSIYKEAIQACEGRLIVLRTLDAGGDKDIPWLSLPKEMNPFLGIRGIRLCRTNPDVIRTQLQAIAEAASEVEGSKVKIMFPMVDTLSELRMAKEMLPRDMECGIMVETPAAVLNLQEMAPECSFVSIGSNDLTQYIMAADRCSEAVSYLYDSFSPAVKKAVAYTAGQAHALGLEVCICGELASDPAATDFLIKCGIDAFSLNHIL